jgi:hypothetical protein
MRQDASPVVPRYTELPPRAASAASDDTNEGDIMIANPNVESGGCRAGIFRHARRHRAATVRPAP